MGLNLLITSHFFISRSLYACMKRRTQVELSSCGWYLPPNVLYRNHRSPSLMPFLRTVVKRLPPTASEETDIQGYFWPRWLFGVE